MMVNIKEGLAAISNEILEDVKTESEKIIRDAETKAAKILRDAKTEAESRHLSLLAEAKEKSELEQKKMKSLTQIEIRNIRLQVKENYINDVFDKALARLKQFVESDRYPSYLLEFIEESSKKIDSEQLVVFVNSKDRKLLKNGMFEDLSKKIGKKLTLADETVDCLGGCIVKTQDMRLQYDNTFEKRLHVLRPNLRIELAKILF
jgi:V/A-type H+-transporting ATPase subunit E